MIGPAPWLAGLGAALIGNLLYHLASRSAAEGGSPFAMLAVVYLVAFIGTAALAIGVEGVRAGDIARGLTRPPVLLLALAVPLIEAGFLWAYRYGAPVSTASLMVNASVAVMLALIGILLFREGFNARMAAGFVLTLAGVALIGWGKGSAH